MAKALSPSQKKWKSLAVSPKAIPSLREFTSSVLDTGLWCLYISKNNLSKDYLTFSEMEHILRELLDVPITELQLKRAFARARNKVIKRKDGAYKISAPGEGYLESLVLNKQLTVAYIEANKPRTAKQTLEALAKSIAPDDLLLCDPYYGVKSLDTLEYFAKSHKTVKFLTAKTNEKKSPLDRAIKDFLIENPNVEIRLSNDRDLHDRYIIARDRFFIVGHGIKDLGGKESFIVGVEDKFGKDIRKTIAKAFSQRWGKAHNII